MNLAIVIGVSKYKNFIPLSQCKKDSESIYNVLNKANKYNDILYINQNTTSGEILNQIDDFINKYKDRNIDEVLFYFSGHGLTKTDDFYYCTTNTEETKINTSSLKNSDIDLSIKSLNPKTYVKIIDACQSGNAYIKGVSDEEKILEKNKGAFKTCYFYSSSKSNQESKVLNTLSSFTATILNILKSSYENSLKEIKYRELTNELSDRYIDNPIQTPFFVQQGTLSEVFLPLTSEIFNEIEKAIHDENNTCEKNEDINSITENISEEVAINFKNNLLTELEKKLKNSTPLYVSYTHLTLPTNSLV